MNWAGTTICSYDLPLRGRRVPLRWLDNDESFYWSFDEDTYEDLY